MSAKGESRLRWGKRGLGLVRALSWCVVAYSALQVGLAAVSKLSPPWGGNLWLLGAVELGVVGGLGGLLLVAEPRDEAGPSEASLGRRLLLGIGIGLALKVPADALRALIDRYWPTPEAELQAQAELLRHDTWSQIACLVVVVGLVGPFVEEVFYRGAIFVNFRRALGRVGAVVLSSVVFALSHASPRDWLPLSLVAVGLGVARIRSDGLAASTAAHVAFNLGALGLLLSGREIDVTRSWIWSCAALVSVVVCVRFLRALGPTSRSAVRTSLPEARG